MQFILASNNKNKLIEYNRIMNKMGHEIISLEEANIDIEVEETENSFIGNAMLKAKAVYELSNKPTISDDSGLEVEILNNEPGIYSARYGGEKCKTDQDRVQYLLGKMEGKSERKARFVCAIALVQDGEEYTFEDYCYGEIGERAVGENGFGYDPVFMVDGKSFSEMSDDAKDSISHRKRATQKLEEWLKNQPIK